MALQQEKHNFGEGIGDNNGLGYLLQFYQGLTMRERLESSDNSLSNLEAETGQIEKHMQKIDEALQKIEASISSASQRGDHEVSASFNKNLSQKTAEKEQQEQAIAQIAAQLSQVGNEIIVARKQNESSKQEVVQLESLGEDTSDGQAKIQEREQTIQALEQRYRELLNRLGKIGSIGGLQSFNTNELSKREPLRISELKPNTIYEKNGYIYQTDSRANTKHVSGPLRLTRGIRNQTIQDKVRERGIKGDIGGHIIGVQFDGPSDAFNLFPQNSELNTGKWSESGWANMERLWVKELKDGKNIKVSIDLRYGENPNRPTEMYVRSDVSDGKSYEWVFKNQAHDQNRYFSVGNN